MWKTGRKAYAVRRHDARLWSRSSLRSCKYVMASKAVMQCWLYALRQHFGKTSIIRMQHIWHPIWVQARRSALLHESSCTTFKKARMSENKKRKLMQCLGFEAECKIFSQLHFDPPQLLESGLDDLSCTLIHHLLKQCIIWHYCRAAADVVHQEFETSNCFWNGSAWENRLGCSKIVARWLYISSKAFQPN